MILATGRAAGRNLRITGHGGAAGGRYETVRITGNGSVNGEVECERLRVTGTAVFRQQVKARRVRVAGNANFSSDLHAAEKLSLSGTVAIQGDLTFNRLACGGIIQAGGRASGEEMSLRGQLTVNSDISAEKLRVRGIVNAGGLLNADTFELYMDGPCSAAEIGGSTIRIRRTRAREWMNRWFRGGDNRSEAVMTVQLIEGDDIELEHAHADVVRGNRVKIGDGCRIGLVEYRTALEVDGQSEIREKRSIWQEGGP